MVFETCAARHTDDAAVAPEYDAVAMIIDVHCHYTLTQRRAAGPAAPGAGTAGRVADSERFSFEPALEDGGPAWDSFISPRATRRLSFRGFQWLLGLDPRLAPGAELDAALERVFADHLLAPGPIERHVLLAFDRYHDAAGRRPPPPVTRRDRGSDIYSSNTFIRAVCRRHPGRFLFGASVHPYRENAVACIDEVCDAGAVLLKWLPLHQNIDIADPRTLAVLRRCAARELPVLVHYGSEFTLATQHPEFVSVAPLLDVLGRLRRDGALPTTIVAHVATPVTPLGSEASHGRLIAALRGEFADAPLYADISALTTWGKIRYLRSVAAAQDLHPKLLFGTDFPVPLGLPRLRSDLRGAYRPIAAERSWPQQVARVARAVGFNEITLHQAGDVLNLRTPPPARLGPA